MIFGMWVWEGTGEFIFTDFDLFEHEKKKKMSRQAFSFLLPCKPATSPSSRMLRILSSFITSIL